MFTKVIDALCAGFNGVLYNGESHRVVGGSGDKILAIRSESTDNTIDIHIDQVTAFIKIK